MGDERDRLPNREFLTRYVAEGLDLSLLLCQGAALYKIWDARTQALDGYKYFQ